MSSTTRSPGAKPPEGDEPQIKKPASPGRYSLSTEGSREMAAVRIDSTRMPAVRPELVAPPPARSADAPVRAAAAPSAPPPSQGSASAALASARPPAKPSAPPKTRRQSSLRPPPPPKRESIPPGVFDFDEGSIAHAFDALLCDEPVSGAGTQKVDLTPVRELFAELAANHMRHVRDFMIDVKWGEATRDWIEISIPAVTSLQRAAERLELTELAHALVNFGAELEASATSSDEDLTARTIQGAVKDRLLDAYGQLVAILPTAFALDRDKSQREAVIVQSLLLSTPDVRKVTIDKLHAAGLTSLKVLFDAKAEEIAQVAGIPEALAARIVERFCEYKSELQNASPQDARAAERERLAALVAQLDEQHKGYEEASRGWSPEAKAKKRELFRAREETWLAITVALARFGEVERLQGIEKVPFAQRIAQITEYLDEARDRYRLA